MYLLHEKLFAALAIAAARQLSEFNVQTGAKTAWALAMVNHLHEMLFAVALAAERQMSEFNVQ